MMMAPRRSGLNESHYSAERGIRVYRHFLRDKETELVVVCVRQGSKKSLFDRLFVNIEKIIVLNASQVCVRL